MERGEAPHRDFTVAIREESHESYRGAPRLWITNRLTRSGPVFAMSVGVEGTDVKTVDLHGCGSAVALFE